MYNKLNCQYKCHIASLCSMPHPPFHSRIPINLSAIITSLTHSISIPFPMFKSLANGIDIIAHSIVRCSLAVNQRTGSRPVTVITLKGPPLSLSSCLSLILPTSMAPTFHMSSILFSY